VSVFCSQSGFEGKLTEIQFWMAQIRSGSPSSGDKETVSHVRNWLLAVALRPTNSGAFVVSPRRKSDSSLAVALSEYIASRKE
jgi:hypothetical protein